MVKKIAVINDLSGLGKCSLTAAIPVLSVLGVQACPLPTAILTNQTGYDSFYWDDYTDKIDHYTEEWQKRGVTFDGIYTGFLGSSAQVEKIIRFLKVFRKEDTLLLVDPVMGDGGKVYSTYSKELCNQMKDLASHANVITPNLTECCLLADVSYDSIDQYRNTPEYFQKIEAMGRSLLGASLHTVIITGIIFQPQGESDSRYYNMVITKEDACTVSSRRYGGSYSGTGDLLASVVCGCLVQGISPKRALEKAVCFLEAALQETVRENIPRNDGINFEPYLKLLLNEP